MSTDDRRAPLDVRRCLLDQAARVLAEEGAAALSVRRLVKAVSTSTMAVYTHFGSMPGLVRALMTEGFDRFHERVARAAAAHPDDPVAELAALCRAYQDFAHDEPDVYAVMFGGSAFAGFALTEEDRRLGIHVLRPPRDAIRRCLTAGRFRAGGDPDLLVRQLFCQMHGLAQLGRAGYIAGSFGPPEVLRGMVLDFVRAAGDRPDEAETSVATGLGTGGAATD
ncbi:MULTISPECIES: TetR/AcrR family transcriptional regulator [unclassified Streptomyces]|uniref:TetR/AcrR family transcriptional regulator n=1 Tax=Streptomyces sp. NPDC005955 TaxID=3364738 RepID=UPI0036B466A7